jgi:MFS family permease
MWLTILGFVLALFAVAAIAPLVGLVFFPMMPAVRKRRRVAPVFMAITTASATAGSLLLFAWIAGLIGIRLSYAMFLLPGVLAMWNDLTRIDRAKRGTTPVALALGDRYDAALQVRMEYGYLTGDVIGILAVPVLLFRSLPLV